MKYRTAGALLSAAIAASVLGADLRAQRGSSAERSTTRLDAPEASRRPAGPRADPRSPGSLPPAFRGASRPAIVLTADWPPSNEGIRRFSDDPVQNPDGWAGEDWEGRGYDVHAYFPEFAPRNCGFCGKGTGDLQVDYQATTADFRPLVGRHAPVAVVTFSRGAPFRRIWELEMNQFNRVSWLVDYMRPRQPTPSPPDASVPPGALRLSKLPVQAIVDAVNEASLGVDARICFSGSGGGFLSEFVAYQGVWYQDDHRSPTFSDWCIAAGHVHVGGLISWPVTRQAVEITLREVIAHVDETVASTVCQPEHARGGPGSAELRVCGDPVATGGSVDLLLEGAPPGALALLLSGPNGSTPFPWQGGLVHPFPAHFARVLPIDSSGRGFLEGMPGGGGPATLFMQVVYRDPAQTHGWGFSNTLAVELLP